MADGMAQTELQLAVEDVEIAFRNLEFAIKLLSHCELKALDPDGFDSEHTTRLAEGDSVFPKGNFSSHEQLVNAAGIGVLVAFSATVLAMDQAFDVAGVGRDPTGGDLERLRVLVYMMRNALAHRIAAPQWVITKDKYRTKLVVPVAGGAVSVDLAAFDGRPFSVEDIGGYCAWYLLRDAAVGALKALG